VNISGTGGSLTVRDFVLPFFGPDVGFETNRPVFNVFGCDFNMEDHTRRHRLAEYSNSFANSQEANLFRNFAGLVLSGKTDPHWPDIALKTQQVMDACMRSARSDGAMVEA
jgi:predicted dehydrogenase